MGEPTDTYYYAQGERIPLTLEEDWLGIHLDRLKRAKLSASQRKRVQDGLRSLRRGMGLLQRSVLPDETLERLLEAGVTEAVYSHGDTLLVPLPEIRVEETREGARAKLEAWLEEHADEIRVTSRRDERLVLEPRTGSGADALALSNALHESVAPEMADVRMLRLVAKPHA